MTTPQETASSADLTPSSAVEQRLAELGLTLPEVAAPVAAYVPAVVSGNHVYTSGQLPFINGKLEATGKVVRR
jgi:enamine deaminase RidA (YjgF/YER057c/UK114 family)